MTDVLIVAELQDGQPRKTTLSAVTAARQIANETSGAFDILVLGQGAEESSKGLAGYGARKILQGEIDGGYVCEKFAPTVAEVATSGGYRVVVATASTFGKELLSRVAGRLGAGIAPDVSQISVVDGDLQYRRPMYAGNVFGTMSVKSDIECVTVRQSEFDPAAADGGNSPVEEVELVEDAVAERIEFVSLETVKSERPELAEADVVVSGGRAFKSAENFKTILEPLVDELGAAMGASRAACDAGYVSSDLQVGQTGKVVAPNLYVAIGISGAIQHLAGMKGSKTIVAINKDNEAPIAQVADYFLVADLFEAVPEMTAAVKQIKAS